MDNIESQAIKEIYAYCKAHPESGKAFKADPQKAYEKFIGKKESWPLPEAKVVVPEPGVLYFVIPPPPGVISDKQLAGVSGGRRVTVSNSTASSFGCFLSCVSTCGSLSNVEVPDEVAPTDAGSGTTSDW